MCSTTTIQTTQRITFTALAEPLALGARARLLHFSPLTVSTFLCPQYYEPQLTTHQTPNRPATSSIFSKTQSKMSILVLRRWDATAAAAEAVEAGADVVVTEVVTVVAVVVSPLLTLHRWAEAVGKTLSGQIGGISIMCMDTVQIPHRLFSCRHSRRFGAKSGTGISIGGQSLAVTTNQQRYV